MNSLSSKPSHYALVTFACPHCHQGIDHRDVARALQWDVDEVYITKYVFRWKYKNGIADLHKALECLQSMISYHESRLEMSQLSDAEVDIMVGDATPGYVNQDR